MPLYCPNCGAANKEFAQYCASCGDDLSAAREKQSKKGQATEPEVNATDSTEKKVLMRSRTNKMVTGLSAGLAKHYNMEVDMVRLLWVAAFAISGGTAIIVYLILAAVTPEEPETAEAEIKK